MDLSKLSSKEFQKEFQETLQKINQDHKLSLACGLITYGDFKLTIPLKEKKPKR